MGARILFVKGGKPGTPGLSRRVVTDRLGRQITHWIRFDQGRAANNPDQLALDFTADPYAAVEIRPETVPEQLEAGRTAIDDLRRQVGRLRDAHGSTATLLAVRLLKDFVATGGAQLIGQKVSGPGDLATLAQVYRDPRLETFRCFYMKGDEVVGECAYSSRLPGAVQLPNAFSDNVKADMARFGADGYYLMHNHPSGSAVPSTADVYLTKYVHQNVPGLRSHVIIDHNEYSTIDGDGKPALFTEPALEGVNFHADPAVDHPMLGGMLTTPKEVALAAKALQMDGELSRSPVLILTKGGEARVQLMVSVPPSLLTMAGEKGARWQAWVRGLGRAAGAGSNAFMVVSDRDYEAAQPALAKLIRDGVVIDAVSASGKSLIDTTTPAPRRVFEARGPGRKVAETAGRYGSDQLGLELRAPTGGDQVVAFPYASGMSRRRDMDAAIESAAGLGTEIGELSDRGMTRIAEAVAEGKPVFVDSGAFNAFKRAMREGTPELSRLDFERVFAKYNELSRRVREHAEANKHSRLNHGLLMMVAPDVIGDQKATLELVEEHADQIAEWIEAGHEVIVPFQKGPIDQYEAFMRVHAALGGLPFVVGIPSAAEALSTADLRRLLSQPYKPDRIHVLGAVSSRRMEERMAVIRDAYEDDVPGVTADAMVMRSNLHEIGGMSGQEKFDKIREILDRVVPTMWGGSLSKSFLDGADEDGFFTGAVIFVKAMVRAHIKRDGTVVREYERKDRNSTSAKYGRVLAAAKQAFDGLPRETQRTLEGWNMNWHISDFAQWENGGEKSAELREQVKEAFKPVREALRREFGDTVRLYRGQRNIDDDEAVEGRQLFSWTPDYQIAADFAHGRRLLKEITDEEIAKQVENFRRFGIARRGRLKFVRVPPPEGYTPDGPDYYFIYDGAELQTDGDDIEADFRSEQADRAEYNAELRERGRVFVSDISVDDVVWIPAGINLKQPELITTLNPLDMMAKADPMEVDLASHPVRADEPTRSQAEAGNYAKRVLPWKGLTIRIENEAGSVRRGTDPDGGTWETHMAHPYGYIVESRGVDGDPVDVYVGPLAETAGQVFVVHQRKFGDWEAYDEDKAMVGFASEEEAKHAFLQCYDDPRFLGDVTAMPVEEFVAKVKATRRAPMVIKAVPLGKAIDKRDTNTLSLFDMMTPVKGYTRSNGRFVAQYVAKRRHSAEAAQPDRPATSVFEPTQIKSATGNNGDFSKDSPVITKSNPIMFVKAKLRTDDRTIDMFSTHVETRTRKDGHVQKYHVANAKPAVVIPDHIKQHLDRFVTPAHEAAGALARARETDKKFRGEGRYAAEVWKDHKPKIDKMHADIEAMLTGIPDEENRAAARAHIYGQMPDLSLTGEESGYFRDTVTESRDELIAEHERLVRVLESPSHEDDKAEAKRQKAELEEYKGRAKPKKATAPTHHRVIVSSPFGQFEVFVEHHKDATPEDYKKDARAAFMQDSGAGNGMASASQIKVVGDPEPVRAVPEHASRVRGAEWAHVGKLAAPKVAKVEPIPGIWRDDVQRERLLDDAQRWAEREMGQYGAEWKRANLAGYLTDRWNIPASVTQPEIDRRFRS